MANPNLKKLVKKGVSKLAKKVKSDAVGTVTDAIRDRAKAKAIKGGHKFGVSKHGGAKARPDIELAANIELKGNRKKRKAKKKIAQWEKQKKSSAAAGSQQAAFLALDRSIKNKQKK